MDQQTPETTPNYTLKDEGYFVWGISRLLIMIRVFGWIDHSGALIKTAYLIIPGLGKNPGNSKKPTIKLVT